MEEHFAVVIGPISCLNFLILGIVLRYYLVTNPLVMLLWPDKIIKHFQFYCSFCKDEAIYNMANIQTFHMFLRLPVAFYKALLLLLSAILFNCVENCVWILFELGKYMWYRISLSFRTKLFHICKLKVLVNYQKLLKVSWYFRKNRSIKHVNASLLGAQANSIQLQSYILL